MEPRSTSSPRDVLPAESRYQLLVKIAAGGMATVYVGRSTAKHGVSRLFAIKRAHPHLSDDAVFRKMFVAEAQLAARIHHPNVVAVQDVEEHDEELLLVMDYVEGTALAKLRPLAESVRDRARLTTRILLDASAGIHAAHELTDERGKPLEIVHRDVSPQNILVGLDGITRIADFGIAKSTGGAAPSTITGAIKGKVGYMAPEYVAGGKVDRRLDVFAMGVVLWECLTGVRMYRQTTSDAELVAAVAACAIERPTAVDADVPPALEAVALRALEKDPNARFATVRDFADALESASRESGLLASHAEVAAAVERIAGRDLARRREIVADRIAPMTPASEPSLEAIEEPTHTRTLEGPLSERTADVGGTLSVPPPTAAPRPRSRTTLSWALVALVVVGVALGVGVGVARRATTTPSPNAGSPAPPATSAALSSVATPESDLSPAATGASPTPVASASGAASARAPARDPRAHASATPRPRTSASIPSSPRVESETTATTPVTPTSSSTPPTPGRAPPNPYRTEGAP